MSQTIRPVAIAFGDFHASLKPPAARAESPSEWLNVQARYLKQLEKLAKDIEVPILCTGDIFDNWNSPAELVNMLLEVMPKIYSIVGNHDLPNHSYAEIRRSSYWTLVRAGRIKNLAPKEMVCVPKMFSLVGFPFGTEPGSCLEWSPNLITPNIALVHKYIWQSKLDRRPNATEDDSVHKLHEKTGGFDTILIGDNHHWFKSQWGNRGTGIIVGGALKTIFNNGTFIRRKADEIDLEPVVGIVHLDGYVEPHRLETSIDRFRDRKEIAEVEEVDLDTEEVLRELGKLADATIDFGQAVRAVLKSGKVSKEVTNLVLKQLESK